VSYLQKFKTLVLQEALLDKYGLKPILVRCSYIISVQLAVKAHGLKQCNLLVHKATKEFKAK
jgi:hypothetical protein